LLVLLGDGGTLNSPGDIQIEVIPENATVVGRVKEVATFIEKLRPIREDQEAMCEPGWNVNLIVILRAKGHRDRLAKGRRPDPDVYRNVQDLTFNHATELCLRAMELVMQTAQNSLLGARVVVLNKVVCYSEFSELSLVINL
jgi:hypothetical protein